MFLQNNSSQSLVSAVPSCSALYCRLAVLRYGFSFKLIPCLIQYVIPHFFYIHNALFRTNKFLISVSHHTFPHGATAPSHTTLGRSPVDEWSARRRNLNLTTHNTQAGFELTVAASEPPLWSLMTLLIPKMFINLNVDCNVHPRNLWRGGAGEGNTPSIFFLPNNSQSRILAIGVRVGERGVCLLRSGSNETSLSF